MVAGEERRALIGFTRRVLVVVLIAGLALALWQLSALIILGFGGVLMAVILSRLSRLLAGIIGLGRTWALALVLLMVLALLVSVSWLFGSEIAEQIQRLGTTARQGLQQMQSLLDRVGLSELSSPSGSMLGHLVTPVSTVLDGLAGALVVAFLGVYLAVAPRPYRDGLLTLVPTAHQQRAGEVVDAVGQALWRWTVGQSVSMAVIFSLVTVTLLLIGVPLALPLGLIAGLLEFVPIIGPWMAAVPAVLIALTLGADTALWVALAFFLIQQVESYLIHPIAERWAVSLPPALAVAATVAFGLLFGFIGVLFATPIAVALMVVVRMLYVRDTLGKDPGTSRMPG